MEIEEAGRNYGNPFLSLSRVPVELWPPFQPPPVSAGERASRARRLLASTADPP